MLDFPLPTTTTQMAKGKKKSKKDGDEKKPPPGPTLVYIQNHPLNPPFEI
jgi:hypothetical protein